PQPNFNSREVTLLGQIRRQPGHVHPEDPTVAEVEAAQKPEITAAHDPAPRNNSLLRERPPLAKQLQFSLVDTWMIARGIAGVDGPRDGNQRAARAEDVEPLSPVPSEQQVRDNGRSQRGAKSRARMLKALPEAALRIGQPSPQCPRCGRPSRRLARSE